MTTLPARGSAQLDALLQDASYEGQFVVRALRCLHHSDDPADEGNEVHEHKKKEEQQPDMPHIPVVGGEDHLHQANIDQTDATEEEQRLQGVKAHKRLLGTVKQEEKSAQPTERVAEGCGKPAIAMGRSDSKWWLVVDRASVLHRLLVRLLLLLGIGLLLIVGRACISPVFAIP